MFLVDDIVRFLWTHCAIGIVSYSFPHTDMPLASNDSMPIWVYALFGSKTGKSVAAVVPTPAIVI